MERLIVPVVVGAIGLLAVIFMMNNQSKQDAAVQPATMEDLAYYLGEWQSETKQTPDGRNYHFGYTLSYYDPNQTMVEMVITQHFEDGAVVSLWHGYKGLDPLNESTYYYGFSPSGRVGRGEVIVEGDNILVTQYEGFGPQGGGVQIRDVFTIQDDDHFEAITYMLQEGEWSVVWEDQWQRVNA